MKVLSKIDRFGQIPRLNFQGNPHASTFVGVTLSICLIAMLAVVFGLLVSTNVSNPSTSSTITQGYADELDLGKVSDSLKFCVVNLGDTVMTNPDGTVTVVHTATSEDLQNLFEQQLQSKVAVYTLSEDNTKINREFRYCPDASTLPVTHCICLNEKSLTITPSDVFHVKITYDGMSSIRNFDSFMTAAITTLIPKKLTDAFLTKSKTYRLPFYDINSASASISLDSLVYDIDDNYFIASINSTYSVLPKSVNSQKTMSELSQQILGWELSFTGQTLTSTTTAPKILSLLAQVGALNGVIITVFSILFLSFFKLKYTENLLNSVNKQLTKTKNDPEGKRLDAKIGDFSDDIELQDNSPQKRAQALVRQNYANKKPLYIGFWEWICPSSKRAAKVKALQENGIDLKKYYDITKVIRTKMELELMKKVLFSPDQLHMLENIPFESFALEQNNKNTIAETPKMPSVNPFEFLRRQQAEEDMQSRFIELMKKHYE